MSLRGAILGFLSIEPASGYTLKQRFDGSVQAFWTSTQSQIYRELKALKRDGRVRFRSEAGDRGPDRKVYTLTPAGRAELAAWLEQPLDPLVLRHPLLLKLVFAAELPAASLEALLDTYTAGVMLQRQDYVARLDDPDIMSLARSGRELALWRLAVEHGIAWCDLELDWVAGVRRELGSAGARARSRARRAKSPASERRPTAGPPRHRSKRSRA